MFGGVSPHFWGRPWSFWDSMYGSKLSSPKPWMVGTIQQARKMHQNLPPWTFLICRPNNPATKLCSSMGSGCSASCLRRSGASLFRGFCLEPIPSSIQVYTDPSHQFWKMSETRKNGSHFQGPMCQLTRGYITGTQKNACLGKWIEPNDIVY